MGWPVHRLGRLLRLEGASLDGPRRRKHNHNRRLHHRSAIAVPRALGDSLDCPGIPGMTINEAVRETGRPIPFVRRGKSGRCGDEWTGTAKGEGDGRTQCPRC